MLEAECGRLRRWFEGNAPDAAVVGLSGGGDSAVALALLRAVMTQPALFEEREQRVVGVVTAA